MSSYSEGQTHLLMEALQAKCFTAEDITKLGQYKRLSDIRLLLCGLAKVVVNQDAVDLDAKPIVPDPWPSPHDYEIQEHIRGGLRIWDPTKVVLRLVDQQKSDVTGHQICVALKGQRVLNANALDFLLANPRHIPEEWKGKRVLFWGTTYRTAYGYPFVRSLVWRDERWCSEICMLDRNLGMDFPAAVLVE